MKRPKQPQRSAVPRRNTPRHELLWSRAIAATPREQLAIPGTSSTEQLMDHPALNPYKNSANAHVRKRGFAKVISLRIAPDLLDELDIFVEKHSRGHRPGWFTRTRVIEDAIRKHIHNGGAAAPRR